MDESQCLDFSVTQTSSLPREWSHTQWEGLQHELNYIHDNLPEVCSEVYAPGDSRVYVEIYTKYHSGANFAFPFEWTLQFIMGMERQMWQHEQDIAGHAEFTGNRKWTRSVAIYRVFWYATMIHLYLQSSAS